MSAHTPGQRYDFEMSQAQFDKLIEAMKPVPYMIFGGMAPRSQQENANDAWAALGEELDFEPMSARPNGRGERSFSAIAKATKSSEADGKGIAP